MKDGRANEKIFERSLLFHHHYFLFLLKLRHRFVAIRFLGDSDIVLPPIGCGENAIPYKRKKGRTLSQQTRSL